MNRRHWMVAGAGAAAVAGGLGVRHWLNAGDTLSPQAAAEIDAQTGGFWGMRFPAPDGTDIVTARLRGQPLLLNFWGTWCPPCVKEMPELDRFAREFAPAGWRVLGLAVDNPKAVREFLARTPVGYTIGLAGFEGSELTRKLGNDQAGLPFTVAFDKRGAVAQRKAGATTLEELRLWAKAA